MKPYVPVARNVWAKLSPLSVNETRIAPRSWRSARRRGIAVAKTSRRTARRVRNGILSVVDVATSTVVRLAARKHGAYRRPQSAAYQWVCSLPASLVCLVCEPPDANGLMATPTCRVQFSPRGDQAPRRRRTVRRRHPARTARPAERHPADAAAAVCETAPQPRPPPREHGRARGDRCRRRRGRPLPRARVARGLLRRAADPLGPRLDRRDEMAAVPVARHRARLLARRVVCATRAARRCRARRLV